MASVMPPNLDALGPYPILQFGVAAIVLTVVAVGALAWLKGEKWGKAAAAAPAKSPVAEVYFDGPLKAIFASLDDIKAHQLLLRLEIKDDIAVLLSGSRQVVTDKLARISSDINDHITECVRDFETRSEGRFRDLNDSINSVHTRIDQVNIHLVRIDTRLEAPKRGR